MLAYWIAVWNFEKASQNFPKSFNSGISCSFTYTSMQSPQIYAASFVIPSQLLTFNSIYETITLSSSLSPVNISNIGYFSQLNNLKF